MNKLIGRFDVVSSCELPASFTVKEEIDSESLYFLSQDEKTFYPLSEFMRSNGRFDGVMGVSNTSAIGAVFSKNHEQATLAILY